MASALEEKDAIRDLLSEYCFALDEGRFDDMAALFTEDGTWDTAFGSATGRPAIVQLVRDIRAKGGVTPARGIHMVANVVIALLGERARVRSNWTVVQNGPDGPKVGSGGAYADELVKVGGAWRFRLRKIDRFIAPGK